MFHGLRAAVDILAVGKKGAIKAVNLLRGGMTKIKSEPVPNLSNYYPVPASCTMASTYPIGEETHSRIFTPAFGAAAS
jgi:hypothetical protein